MLVLLLAYAFTQGYGQDAGTLTVRNPARDSTGNRSRPADSAVTMTSSTISLGGQVYSSGTVAIISESVVGYTANGAYAMHVGPVPGLLLAAPSACTASSPATADPITPDLGNGTKNRYCSFAAGDAGQQQAVQVTFTSLPGYEFAEGRTAWVQQPYLATEASGSSGGGPEPTFWVAELGCAAHYDDWTQYGVVDLIDDAIVPRAIVELLVVSEDCDAADPGAYSAPLEIHMSMVGDVVGDCGVTPCTSPQGVIDFVDISSVVDKFRNLVAAPRKARADIVHSDIAQALPDKKVDFVDISLCVDAFRNHALAFPGPPLADPCP